MKIHHIGYLVRNLNKALNGFLKLGFVQTSDIFADEFRGINICFLEKDGYLIELVSPKSKDSVVYNLCKKFGNTPYHICYHTSDINAEIRKLRNSGYVICNEIHSAIALDNNLICFMIHPYLGMIELVEM